MNEKIYCWGQLTSDFNSCEPTQLKTPENYTSLNLSRNSSLIWKGNSLYSWGSFVEAPTLLLKKKTAIVNAGFGVEGPLVHTHPISNDTKIHKEKPIKVVGNSSGHVYLTKAFEARSWLTKSLILDGIIDVSSGCSDFFALSKTGQVYKWAHIHSPKQLNLQEKVKSVSSGTQHSVFLTENLNLYVLGSNAYGQLSLGDMLETEYPIMLQGIVCKKAICGGFHTVVLTDDEKLYSCGLGNMGQLISGAYTNITILTECLINPDLGRVSDIYCTELTSFISFQLVVQNDSFRPFNLLPKGSIIKFLHKQMVAAAEWNYLSKVENEEKSRNEKKKQQLIREEVIHKTLRRFENHIIPNWHSCKSSKELSEYILKGLPSKVRGQVWALLAGNPLAVNADDFQECLLKATAMKSTELVKEESSLLNSIKLISLDISRTFNTLGYFSRESPLSKDLQELLEAACMFKTEIGYTQGMSYIGGMLLLNLEIVQAFQVFVRIISSPLLLPFFKIDQEGIQARESLFMDILNKILNDIFKLFTSQGVQPAVFLMEWFITLYSKTLGQETAARIWDLYFYFGDIILFKTGFAILHLISADIMQCDLAGIMQILGRLSDKIKDPDEMVKKIEIIKIPETFEKIIKNM